MSQWRFFFILASSKLTVGNIYLINNFGSTVSGSATLLIKDTISFWPERHGSKIPGPLYRKRVDTKSRRAPDIRLNVLLNLKRPGYKFPF